MAERANDMDELAVAEAMAKGDLPSPQRYGSFWLFSIRITGTGLSYRMGRDEFVWRDAELYLNDRFIKRCNGLPVIFDHPEKKTAIDSEEFNNRIVGTTFLPFIKGEDVWAIVKIYDEPTVEMMLSEQLSTSPAVVFRESTSTNETIKLDDGSALLIEGFPALLDHIAIVTAGVWDKSGPPTGVDTGALGMAEKEKEEAAADKARHDASLERMDAFMDALKDMKDSIKHMHDRMDAAEKDKRHDAARKDKFGHRKDGESYKDYKKRHDDDEMAMADALAKHDGADHKDCMDSAHKARHDAEEEEKRADKEFEEWAKEEEKEPEHKEDKKDSKKDSARKDESEDEKEEKKIEKEEKEEERGDKRHDSQLSRENAELKARLAKLEGTVKIMRDEVPASERDALAAAQVRADSVMAMLGDRAPAPIPGETSLDYRKRLASRLRQHSPRFKESRFDGFDSVTMGLVEDQVYADAVASAKAGPSSTPGVLVPFQERDSAGRLITRFHGDIGAFIAPFVPQDRQLVKLNRPQKGVM